MTGAERKITIGTVFSGINSLFALALENNGQKGSTKDSIASAIPISFGGIGLREFAFVIGSQYLSIDQNIAVSLSLLFYATSLVSALPGSFYAFRLLIRKKNNNSSSDYPASPLKAPLS